MTNWTFQDESRLGPKTRVESIDHAVQLFLAASGESEYAVCIDFSHVTLGAMSSIAGPEFATLAFDPMYDSNSQSLAGFRSAALDYPPTENPMYFVDDNETLSSIDAAQLIPVLDVVRGIQYILQHHDYPPFFNWRTGC